MQNTNKKTPNFKILKKNIFLFKACVLFLVNIVAFALKKYKNYFSLFIFLMVKICVMDINNFVFVCVGNSSVLFDSFGAVVGDALRSKNLPAFVFGGVENCITTNNVKEVINQINLELKNKKIVIVDCTCLNNFSLNNSSTNNAINFNIKSLLKQKIELKKGKVKIANINYECGDYNILCETFCIVNNKVFSLNINDVFLLANKVVNKIFEIFKI